MDYYERVSKAVEIIKKAESLYCLTGAGISTESGIPDFRSPKTGLWEKIDPMKESTVEALYTNPSRFYKVAFPRYASFKGVKPNDGHAALVELEKMGYLKGIITQNIDNLHKRAGSRKVWEVHGNTRKSYCIGCDAEYAFEKLIEQLEKGKKVPGCEKCGGMLRPDIVLFGDPMPQAYYNAAEVIRKQCDCLLVVGSSLQVQPVAALPRFVSSLIIINLQPTPYDKKADVVIREKAGKTLKDIVTALST